jgi:hypothetical protein
VKQGDENIMWDERGKEGQRKGKDTVNHAEAGIAGVGAAAG